MSDTEDLLLDQCRAAQLFEVLLSLTQSPAAVHFSIEDVEARLELLEGYWVEVQQRDYKLQRLASTLMDRPYFKVIVYSGVIDNYLSAKGWFRQRTRVLKEQLMAQTRPAGNEPGVSVMSTQASLEKLKLPFFDGNQREWEAFKDKFTALIINDTKMEPVIKIQHLANCLGKEPAEKLKGIKFVGTNFETAWKALCNRYDIQYLRFSVQMQTLVNMPMASTEKVKHLCHLINTVDESINTFNALGRPHEHWGDIFVYFIVSRFADTTRLDWIKEIERRKIADGIAKYDDIKKFSEERIRSLDVVESRMDPSAFFDNEESIAQPNCSNKASYKENNKFSTSRRPKGAGAHVATKQPAKSHSKQVCSFCKSDHFVGYCTKFSASSLSQRRQHAAAAQLCFNCLNSNHSAETCQSKGRCFVCGNKHHTKLHREAQMSTNATLTVDPATTSDTSVGHADSDPSNRSVMTTGRVILSTACVVLQGPQGQSLTVRALLDSGAEESFLSEHVVQALSLHKSATNTMISGVGAATTAIARNRVSVCLKSSKIPDFKFTLSALVLKKSTAHSEIGDSDASLAALI